VRKDSHCTFQWLRAAAPDKPLHVVFLTWPSERFITLLPSLDVSMLGRRSEFNGFYLAQLIGHIPPEHPVSLLGHSHGARTTLSTLHLLGGGRVQGKCVGRCSRYQGHRLRAVLAAAAVDHHWLNPGERYDRAVCRSEAIVTLRNKRDRALWFYPLHKPFGRSALSHSGLHRSDRMRLGSCNSKMVEFDVAPLVGNGHMWPHYYCRPEIASALVPYLYFSDDPPRVSTPPPAPAKAKTPAGVIRESQSADAVVR
jgi:hypothetical protein